MSSRLLVAFALLLAEPCLDALPQSLSEVREACPEVNPHAEEDDVSLLQLSRAASRVASQTTSAQGSLSQPLEAATDPEAAATKLNEPYPIGRVLISTDPKASAKFFFDYFEGSKALGLPGCAEGERAGVDLDIGWGKRALYVFVKDETKPVGNMTPSDLVSIAAKDWVDVVAGREFSTMWAEFHDGFFNETFKLEAAVEAGVSISYGPMGIMRVPIPHTFIALEVHPQVVLGDPSVSEFMDPDPDFVRPDGDCNDVDNSHPLYANPWFKTTFMTADPSAAAKFAVKVLGAAQVASQFDGPIKPGCTSGTWVRFPGSGYELHFPYSPEFEIRSPSIKEFAAYVEDLRDLGAGVFDGYMYDSMVLKVVSLDPFMERLRSEGIAFKLTRLGEGQFALFADIPNTGITMQLRGTSASVAESVTADLCMEQSW